MRQDRAGDGGGALVIAREHGRRERCSKACYSDCLATSARVHRVRWSPVEDARTERTRAIASDPSTPAASTHFVRGVVSSPSGDSAFSLRSPPREVPLASRVDSRRLHYIFFKISLGRKIWLSRR